MLFKATFKLMFNMNATSERNFVEFVNRLTNEIERYVKQICLKLLFAAKDSTEMSK